MHKINMLVACLFVCSKLSAQENVAGRVPVYPVQYKLPTVDSIKEVLNRVRLYYQSTGPIKIIDGETKKEITDFSEPNKNAKVAGGFAAEWSYTNGVVLSSFVYMKDVTGDKNFFENNVRFYDFVTTNLPYFRKNAAKFGKEAGGWPAIMNMQALDDCGSIGAAMIKTYLKTKNKAYLPLIDTIASYISGKQFRLQDGTLARHRPQYQSVWADDMYMSVPFWPIWVYLPGKKNILMML